MMNNKQIYLYQRIQAYSLDRPESKLSFSKRLARDNGWSQTYTQQAIAEYKKFVFLAVAAGHKVTPSDQIDQVWHLHLTYTRSYWQDFCPNVLQTSLHHEPTRGGSSEQTKFDDWYGKTLESYEKFFGTPPIEIWSSPKVRFGRDLYFKRVNVKQNWVIPKPNFTFSLPKFWQVKWLLLLSLLSLVVTSCSASSLRIPFISGIKFLTRFYIPLGIISLLLAYWLHYQLRLPKNAADNRQLHLNLYETAFLAGGNKRAVGTAIVSLVKNGYVEVVPKKLLSFTTGKKLAITNIDRTLPAIEMSVAQKITRVDGNIKRVFDESTNLGSEIYIRLQQLGLILSDRQSFQAKFFPLLIVFWTVGIGVLRIFIGIYRDRPFGYLTFCVLAILVFSLGIFSSYRSRYGDRILTELLAKEEHLKNTGSDEPNLPLAFALFGTNVLKTDSAMTDLHQMIAFSSSDSSSSDSSSFYNSDDDGADCGDGADGGGDGGCGGGGCGGCGGCGG